MSNSDLDEIVDEFVVESLSDLDELELAFVTLEQHAEPDSLAKIFRTVHTIKGTSGFLGFGRLESLTHVGENVLSKLRDGDLAMSTEITNALLQMNDAVREILQGVADNHEEPAQDYDQLIATLTAIDNGDPMAGSSDSETAVEAVEDEPAALDTPAVASSPEALDLVLESLATPPAPTPPDHAPAPATATPPTTPTESAPDERHQAAESIRVDVRLLDELMNSVGELVLARNQVLQFTESHPDNGFPATSQRLNLITTELQESVMQTRMQPIENVWNKFPRVIRDLTQSIDKQARLEMEGKHTELDKTLLEAIRDPLTHLVRNSVDHGIETVADRRAAGKPDEGVVRLSARHEGGQVVVEISDDGAGIEADKIRAKAVEKGILTPEDATSWNDRDIIGLIFRAGFSTAAAVTNISGRGVGMDVVRTNIENIGGSVDIQSVPGSGTTFVVRIPLTLAIIPALMVTSRGDRYAIPQANLLELVRIEAGAVEEINGFPIYRLRGRLLPLVRLSTVFDPCNDRVDGEVAVEQPCADEPDLMSHASNVVVVQADGCQFGIIVDEVNDTNEIVVKPLGRYLQHVSALAGATILGDGYVALILDIVGFAAHVGLSSGADGGRALDLRRDLASDLDGQGQLLLVRVGDGRFALPLHAVERLEQFALDRLERTNHRLAVQYGPEIMPIVRLGDEIGVASDHVDDLTTTTHAIIYSTGARSVGLLVDEVVDIVSHSLETQNTNSTGTVVGSSVIDGRITDFIDVPSLLQRAVPDAFENDPSDTEAA
ncbi:MAG: chemotaxis protein CheA [Ilumatobacter sp.]